jgi:hypothetical protein
LCDHTIDTCEVLAILPKRNYCVMTTKSNLQGLTIAEIKSNYPQGQYKSSMKKIDVINAALASVNPEKKTKSNSMNREPGLRRS